ncbi:hypothetical protein T265_05644 [Opisthorchis viverrini]|uniref:Major facilitator superfamily (MFS) profile domain-containing protein n=1 Tax=Opisthorchis viverrini TaxID=6198 RepID=A0A075AF35_OPIVI|nr:hypothetical protein T265_05644 [Opisthorchis viverrini]KER27324.1 hypothetical protein T265_05644 [Opisthorchis viverrini]
MNSALSHFSFSVSGDPEAMARGIYGVGVALSPRAERALLDWIPVNSRLCAVRLSSSIKLNASRNKKRCLFVVSAYAPTDCISDAEKDTFCRELSGLIRQAKSTDIVILAGDLNAQVGRLSSLESHLGGRFGVDARRTENGDRLLQLCADHELFLASTNFQHKRSHRVTWRPPTTNQPWTQLDHVAISHRWRATTQDCRSFWGTQLDSDHAVVRARLTVRFPSGHCKSARSIPIHCLRRTAAAQQYRSELAQQLSTVKQYCGGRPAQPTAIHHSKLDNLTTAGHLSLGNFYIGNFDQEGSSPKYNAKSCSSVLFTDVHPANYSSLTSADPLQCSLTVELPLATDNLSDTSRLPRSSQCTPPIVLHRTDSDRFPIQHAGDQYSSLQVENPEQLNTCLSVSPVQADNGERPIQPRYSDVLTMAQTVALCDSAPNGEWGWLVILGSFMCIFIVDGLCHSYGLYMYEMVAESQVFVDPSTSGSAAQHLSLASLSFPGALLSGITLLIGPVAGALVNRFDYRSVAVVGAVIATVCILSSALITYDLNWFAITFGLLGGPVAGALVNRFDYRSVAVVGAVIATVCILSSALITYDLNWFAITFGLLGGIGCGLVYLPAITVVGHWFDQHRAFVVGLAMCGNGFGAGILPIVTRWLCDSMTWRGALVITAGLFCQALVGIALFRPLYTHELIRLAQAERRRFRAHRRALMLSNVRLTVSDVDHRFHSLANQPSYTSIDLLCPSCFR